MSKGTAVVRLAIGILGLALTLAYPLVVLAGLRTWPPHVLSLVLLGILTALLVGRRLASAGGGGAAGGGETLWPLLAACLLLLGALFRQSIFVTAMPVLVSGALLATFALSLKGPQSMVERFARRQEPHLSPEKVRYCRQVTVVWCWFFALNIGVTLALAAAAPLSWWGLYTGVIAYVLIGALFSVEYVVRKSKFRDYGTWWHDRLLAAVFPRKDDGV